MGLASSTAHYCMMKKKCLSFLHECVLPGFITYTHENGYTKGIIKPEDQWSYKRSPEICFILQ